MIAREHLVGVVGQGQQQIEFPRSQTDSLPVYGDLPAGGIDGDAADVSRPVGIAAFARRPTQDGPNASHQFARIEGLGHIVVGAHFQGDDFVDVLIPGRQHENRNIALCPNAAAYFPAVDARHHQIEHQQGRLLLPDLLECFCSVLGRLHAKALFFEIEARQVADAGLVVGNENRIGHGRKQRMRPRTGFRELARRR